MAQQTPDDISINTIIGPGSRITGELIVNGFVRIDGDLDGSITTPNRVIIGDQARIRGTVRSRVVTVGGVVQGDVIAPEGVTLLSSATVLGTVLTKKLKVESSVVLHGPCFAINDQERFDHALSRYNNQKAYSESTFASASLRDQ